MRKLLPLVLVAAGATALFAWTVLERNGNGGDAEGVITSTTNATVNVPTFTPGTTSPVAVTGLALGAHALSVIGTDPAESDPARVGVVV